MAIRGWMVTILALTLTPVGVTSFITRETHLRLVFKVDVAIDGFLHRLENVVNTGCSLNCLATPGCQSLAFQAATATCWLYRHLVEFSTNGSAAPGTQYSWLLSPRCPTELGFSLEQGLCYIQTNQSAVWKDADEMCRALGGTLFIADTPEKLAFLRDKAFWRTWVGASDIDEEGSFRWVDGGTLQKTSALWGPHQPDDYSQKQDVVLMETNGMLDDVPMGADCDVVCQIHMI